MTGGRCGALAILALLAAIAACGGGRRDFLTSDPPPSPPPVIPIGDPDAGATAPCAASCSLDLTKVIRGCDEEVLYECAVGQGCAHGECVSPCDSAAAAQGSRGCHFMALPPPDFKEGRGSCFAAFLANTWNQPAELEVYLGGQRQDVSRSLVIPDGTGTALRYEPLTGPLPIGAVAILFLAQDSTKQGAIQCPAAPMVVESGAIETTGRLAAFEVKASVPISAYSIYPYGGAVSFLPSATLLLPLSSWGKGYRLVDPWQSVDLELLPAVQVLAAEDDTELTLVPSSAITAGTGVDAAPAGVPTQWRLGKGEAIQIVQPKRLLGSPLTANKPVAVFGASSCAFLPESRSACDSLQQQIPPQTAWGIEYAALRHRGRGDDEELTPWRILAAVDGTTLRYDPAPPEGAPTTLAAGESAVFWSGQPFVVGSQDVDHPIFMNGYMTGGSTYNGIGDPDFVNVVATEQFLNSYVFFSDYTYAEGSLNFIRRSTAKGFQDVTLDCAGVLSGWQPLGRSGRYEYVRVDLVRGHQPQTFADKTCTHGRHEAHSDGPFGLTVWGFDTYASYAYPGGAGTRTVNTVDIR